MNDKRQKDNLLHRLLNYDVVSFTDPDANLRVKLGFYPNMNLLTYRKAKNERTSN